ncbi:interferon kappa [Urocitellus parryii]|uniref:Interferon kappa n=1 Tax=Urocitellus parryii TaxID=9999 RepID=A0A8D2KFW2_UROPR|nr:interferon kappa [Urocitellus parryii]
MTPKYTRLALLVDLFMTHILCQECNLLKVHLGTFTWENLMLLNKMSNSIPVECFREIHDFELPKEILLSTQPEKTNIKYVFYETFTQAINIFSQNTFNSSWDEEQLVQLQSNFYEQVEYLKQCLKKENKEKKDVKADEKKHSGAGVLPLGNLKLRRYFSRIYNFLKGKTYSRCAWEIVRVEIRRYFYYLKKFTTLLTRK